MRLALLALVFLLAAPFLAAPSLAMAADCGREPAPRITLETRQDPARYDTSRTLADLQTLQISNSVHRAGNMVTMGAAASKMGLQYQAEFKLRDMRDGTFCVTLTKVQITVAMTENNIFIASELPRGSCIYNEVLRHENKHFNTDLDLIRDWRPRMEAAIQSGSRHIGQVRASSASSGQSTLQDRLAPVIEAQTTAMIADRAARQARVDSTQEYERISRSCNGEGQKYVRKFLKGR